MTKFCLSQWNKNKDKLRAVFQTEDQWLTCSYKDLVGAVVENVLNNHDEPVGYWDASKIHEIDDGDYQGTLLFLIPMDTYQPAEHEYLITFVDYGSCSGCDTLKYAQSIGEYSAKSLSEKQAELYMTLCKDILANMKKPFNTGWRHDEKFDVVIFEEKGEQNEID